MHVVVWSYFGDVWWQFEFTHMSALVVQELVGWLAQTGVLLLRVFAGGWCPHTSIDVLVAIKLITLV